MLKNDRWILSKGEKLISPFEPGLIREVLDTKLVSYGLSSFGYDIRLSSKDFRTFRHIPGTVVDPKAFNPDNLEAARWHRSYPGDYFILPGHSYGLGVAVERLTLPRDVTAICLGKSTYARCGVIVNMTPAEAGWSGHLTLEFSNSSPSDVRLYTNEGIAQLLFLSGEDCDTSYADRNGKYQNQSEEITIARI